MVVVPHRWLTYAVVVLALHVTAVTALLSAAQAHPILFGMGLLAYTLGLRHAFDADHIAAIDNTVRKLLRDGQPPAGVGLYFSLGHSTVVFIMALGATAVAHWAKQMIPHLQVLGGVAGNLVSGAFLVLIGALNLATWMDIYRVFHATRDAASNPSGLDDVLLTRGFISRIASPLFRLVTRSWHVYPVGFLFGLGFDTASEIALLALSAGAASGEIPLLGVAALPLLFAAGMSLMDTADGVLMTAAYRWASDAPIRRIYYNLTVTGLSVVAALLIGGVELVQAFGQTLRLNGPAWMWIQGFDFGRLGYVLVAVFLVAWSGSYAAWKIRSPGDSEG